MNGEKSYRRGVTVFPNRKSLRLKTYDYSLPGAYFVTVCTHQRQRLFCAEISCERNGTQAVPYIDREEPSGRNGTQAVPYIDREEPSGRNGTQAAPYADGEWSSTVGHDLCVVPNAVIHKWVRETERKYRVRVDRYIIMRDHIHLLIFIEEQHGKSSLPDMMRWFKTMTTNDYIRAVKAGILLPFKQKLWQKSYYDHIVRNDEDYEKTWQYIENNPTQYVMDLQNKHKKKHNPFL